MNVHFLIKVFVTTNKNKNKKKKTVNKKIRLPNSNGLKTRSYELLEDKCLLGNPEPKINHASRISSVRLTLKPQMNWKNQIQNEVPNEIANFFDKTVL